MSAEYVSKLPEYAVWSAMLSRCNNPKNSNYHRYGARGIVVCERWLKFKNFIADMGPRPSGEHSLDRIDNDGNYEPENCRWATLKEQARNTSRNRLLTHDGRTMCLDDWAREIDVSPSCLSHRLEKMTVSEAISAPYEEHAEHGAAVTVDGVPMSHERAAEALGYHAKSLTRVIADVGRDLTTTDHSKMARAAKLRLQRIEQRPAIQTRQCRRCKHVGPLEDFRRDRTRPGGRATMCHQCNRDDVREREQLKRLRALLPPSPPDEQKGGA